MKKILLTILLCLWATVAFAASISTLTDNFDDNSFDTSKWILADGSVTETSQQLWFTTETDGSPDPEIHSKVTYDFTGASASIKIIDAGNQTLASFKFAFDIWKSDWSNNVGWAIQANVIHGETYDADTFRYLRIRESGGRTYLDYSSDGITWTNHTSYANLFDMTDVYVDIRCVSSAEASSTTAKVDDFNILPSATAPTYSHAFNNGFGEGLDQGFN